VKQLKTFEPLFDSHLALTLQFCKQIYLFIYFAAGFK